MKDLHAPQTQTQPSIPPSALDEDDISLPFPLNFHQWRQDEQAMNYTLYFRFASTRYRK